MAKVFVNYTPEQLLALSFIMAEILIKEYDEDDQVILSDLLNQVSTNMGLIISQRAYLEGVLSNDVGGND